MRLSIITALIGTIVSAAASASSLGVVQATDVTTTNVMADLNSCAGFSLSDYQKYEAYEHSQAMGGDIQALTIADGQEQFKSVYLYLYHPSAKALNYWDATTQTYSAAGGFKVKMSTSLDWNAVTRYDAKVQQVSTDGLFVKVKITSDQGFGFSDYSQTRGYEFDSFEIMDETLSKSNSYALGNRFTVSGKGSDEKMTHDVVNVVTLNAKAFGYQYKITNSHSYDVNDNGGFLPEGTDWLNNHKVYTKVFSLGFHLPASYGDCIGVKLDWKMMKYYSEPDETSFSPIAKSLESHSLNFTDSDHLTIPDHPESLRKALENMSLKAFTTPGWSSTSVDCIQKVNTLAISADSNGDYGPYLLDSTGVSYYSTEKTKAPTDNFYVLHFDYRDTIFSQAAVPWWMWITIATAIESIIYLGSHKGTAIQTWAASDVAIIDLTMRKDGNVYVLKTSSDSNSTKPSAFDTDKGFDWKFWLEVIAVVAGIVLVAWLTVSIVKDINGAKSERND